MTSSSTACWPGRDCRADPSLTWAEQITELAQRLRWCWKTTPASPARPRSAQPASLALTEAFLTPLHAARMPGAQPPSLSG